MVRGIKSLLTRFTALCNDCQLASVRAEHIDKFFYGPDGLSLTCSVHTLAKYRNELKQFLNYCHRRDWTTHTGDFLVAGIVEKRTDNNRNRYRMTRAELLAMIEAADHPRDKALTVFMANTACRISEARAMRIRDVSFTKGELYVKLVKTREETIKPLTLDLDEALRAWLTYYTNEVGSLQPDYRLFPAFKRNAFTSGGGRQPPGALNPTAPMSQETLIIRGIAERAGLDLEPGDGWHTIRRSVARVSFDAWSEQGYDSAGRMAQAMLNHKRFQTTEQYLGLEIESQKVSKAMKGQRFLITDSDAEVIELPSRRNVSG